MSGKVSLGALFFSQKFLKQLLDVTKCERNFNSQEHVWEYETLDDQDICLASVLQSGQRRYLGRSVLVLYFFLKNF